MNIKIYSTPTCPYCQIAKLFLQENKIPYTEVNVAADRAAALEMVQKSNQLGVPVFDIDGNILIGFDREKFKELLHIQ